MGFTLLSPRINLAGAIELFPMLRSLAPYGTAGGYRLSSSPFLPTSVFSPFIISSASFRASNRQFVCSLVALIATLACFLDGVGVGSQGLGRRLLHLLGIINVFPFVHKGSFCAVVGTARVAISSRSNSSTSWSAFRAMFPYPEYGYRQLALRLISMPSFHTW